MDISNCGAFITALRKERSLTQKQLAGRLNVTDKAVSRWETGRGIPDAASLLALSNEFGVTVNELLLGERFSPEQSAQTETALLSMVTLHETEQKKAKRLAVILIAVSTTFLLLFGAVVGIGAWWLQHTFPSVRPYEPTALANDLLTAETVTVTIDGEEVADDIDFLFLSKWNVATWEPADICFNDAAPRGTIIVEGDTQMIVWLYDRGAYVEMSNYAGERYRGTYYYAGPPPFDKNE
ncbi:MAG: helix-turn-helix transcriptional regulator [Clostridia bacterium]|nr:helix-turn-helix transcriptional regulator [Clostridia bacterium]